MMTLVRTNAMDQVDKGSATLTTENACAVMGGAASIVELWATQPSLRLNQQKQPLTLQRFQLPWLGMLETRTVGTLMSAH